MNKLGWKLIQVVGRLQSEFGMVFEKINKRLSLKNFNKVKIGYEEQK